MADPAGSRSLWDSSQPVVGVPPADGWADGAAKLGVGAVPLPVLVEDSSDDEGGEGDGNNGGGDDDSWGPDDDAPVLPVHEGPVAEEGEVEAEVAQDLVREMPTKK